MHTLGLRVSCNTEFPIFLKSLRPSTGWANNVQPSGNLELSAGGVSDLGTIWANILLILTSKSTNNHLV